jgi:FkbM family methyltransferase
MRRALAALRHVAHNISVGWAVARHAPDLQSRIAVVGLAAVLTIKQRSRWRRSTVRVRVRIGGTEFPVHIGAHTDLEVLYEIAVAGEYDELPSTDAKVIVDLGAHIGLATLRLLAANPGARVLAVEADPYLIGQLRDNVAGLPVTVVNAAVSARSGPRVFYRSDVFSWGNSLKPTMPQQTPVTVRGETFSDLLAEAGVTHVDLLKLDIEGAEWEVFARGFPPSVDAVVGEIHASDGRGPRALVDVLAKGMTIRIGRESDSLLLFHARRL